MLDSWDWGERSHNRSGSICPPSHSRTSFITRDCSDDDLDSDVVMSDAMRGEPYQQVGGFGLDDKRFSTDTGAHGPDVVQTTWRKSTNDSSQIREFGIFDCVRLPRCHLDAQYPTIQNPS